MVTNRTLDGALGRGRIDGVGLDRRDADSANATDGRGEAAVRR